DTDHRDAEIEEIVSRHRCPLGEYRLAARSAPQSASATDLSSDRRAQALEWTGQHEGEKMSDRELCYLSVHDVGARIRRREVSPVEVVESHLRRIDALNPRLSAFLTMTADRALQDARRAEAEIAAGRWRGPLHGIPYGAKDIIETAGVRTTHGSSFF